MGRCGPSRSIIRYSMRELGSYSCRDECPFLTLQFLSLNAQCCDGRLSTLKSAPDGVEGGGGGCRTKAGASKSTALLIMLVWKLNTGSKTTGSFQGQRSKGSLCCRSTNAPDIQQNSLLRCSCSPHGDHAGSRMRCKIVLPRFHPLFAN